MGSPPAIWAATLDIAYENSALVVQGAEAEIHPGQLVALVGENGSGKTSLLRVLAGLLTASAGIVEIFGHPVDSSEARRALTFVGDTPTFYDGISVRENLDFVGRLHGSESVDGHPVVGLLGIGQNFDALPRRLSPDPPTGIATSGAAIREKVPLAWDIGGSHTLQ